MIMGTSHEKMRVAKFGIFLCYQVILAHKISVVVLILSVSRTVVWNRRSSPVSVDITVISCYEAI
jgi:hypothetical protein